MIISATIAKMYDLFFSMVFAFAAKIQYFIEDKMTFSIKNGCNSGRLIIYSVRM